CQEPARRVMPRGSVIPSRVAANAPGARPAPVRQLHVSQRHRRNPPPRKNLVDVPTRAAADMFGYTRHTPAEYRTIRTNSRAERARHETTLRATTGVGRAPATGEQRLDPRARRSGGIRIEETQA